jgi:hypothetical protein
MDYVHFVKKDTFWIWMDNVKNYQNSVIKLIKMESVSHVKQDIISINKECVWCYHKIVKMLQFKENVFYVFKDL